MSIRSVSLLLSPLLALYIACGGADKVSLMVSGGATGTALELTVAGAQRFMDANPGVQVHVVPTPVSLAGRQSFYELLSERQSPDVDVYQIDVIWAGMFAEHAVDISSYVSEAAISKHFDAVVANNTVRGKLVAMPWYTDAPLLFYRSDLLAKYGYDEPPATWDTLEIMAKEISDGEREAGNLGFWGYVWQGRAYEGLTCNALEWQGSHGGGNFIDESGQVRLTNLETMAAFERAASWMGTISPLDVTTMEEEEARLFWQKGDAVFMRNWPSVYSDLKRDDLLANRFGVAPLPAGPGGRAATLGGWNLMVSRYSNHPEEAAALVAFLTSEAEQKRRALEGAYMPTIDSLYQDPEVQAAIPFITEFEGIRKYLVARPSAETGSNYDEVSKAYWNAAFDILHGAPVRERLQEAERTLSQIMAP